MDLLDLCTQCKAVIACRVSPIQKARLVSLSRSSKPSLGHRRRRKRRIHDPNGHVGVGIRGVEERATRADYSIGQFRFLKTLLLVHGRSNHVPSKVVLYSVYKNTLLILVNFAFAFLSAFMGSRSSAWLTTAWNICFTSVPILVVGVLVAIFLRDGFGVPHRVHRWAHEQGLLHCTYGALVRERRRARSGDLRSALVFYGTNGPTMLYASDWTGQLGGLF